MEGVHSSVTPRKSKGEGSDPTRDVVLVVPSSISLASRNPSLSPGRGHQPAAAAGGD